MEFFERPINRKLWLSGCLVVIVTLITITIAGQALVPRNQTPTPAMTFAGFSTSTPVPPTIISYPTNTETPKGDGLLIVGNTLTPTFTALPLGIPIAALEEVDKQIQGGLLSNIAYLFPESMKLEETVVIVLLLNPHISPEELRTQVVDNSGYPTSQADTAGLVAEQGGKLRIASGTVEISNHMKAILESEDEGAFDITEFHDNAIQPLSNLDTTIWRWAITAKEGGKKSLRLTVFRLIKSDGQEFWREVEAYRANIIVTVTPAQWLSSLDWKWFLGIVLTALLIPFFWRRYDASKKADFATRPSPPIRRRYRSS